MREMDAARGVQPDKHNASRNSMLRNATLPRPWSKSRSNEKGGRRATRHTCAEASDTSTACRPSQTCAHHSASGGSPSRRSHCCTQPAARRRIARSGYSVHSSSPAALAAETRAADCGDNRARRRDREERREAEGERRREGGGRHPRVGVGDGFVVCGRQMHQLATAAQAPTIDGRSAHCLSYRRLRGKHSQPRSSAPQHAPPLLRCVMG